MIIPTNNGKPLFDFTELDKKIRDWEHRLRFEIRADLWLSKLRPTIYDWKDEEEPFHRFFHPAFTDKPGFVDKYGEDVEKGKMFFHPATVDHVVEDIVDQVFEENKEELQRMRESAIDSIIDGGFCFPLGGGKEPYKFRQKSSYERRLEVWKTGANPNPNAQIISFDKHTFGNVIDLNPAPKNLSKWGDHPSREIAITAHVRWAGNGSIIEEHYGFSAPGTGIMTSDRLGKQGYRSENDWCNDDSDHEDHIDE